MLWMKRQGLAVKYLKWMDSRNVRSSSNQRYRDCLRPYINVLTSRTVQAVRPSNLHTFRNFKVDDFFGYAIEKSCDYIHLVNLKIFLSRFSQDITQGSFQASGGVGFIIVNSFLLRESLITEESFVFDVFAIGSGLLPKHPHQTNSFGSFR